MEYNRNGVKGDSDGYPAWKEVHHREIEGCMMSKNKIVGLHQWEYESEKIEQLPGGVYSVGVGQDLVEKTGRTMRSLVDGLDQVFESLIDGGGSVGKVDDVVCYCLRRGNAIEIGTRKDFEDLGWGLLCDRCDQVSRRNG